MSGNPNRQKIGKRKNAPAKQQAAWLFPSTENSAATVPNPQTHSQSTNKQDEQLAKDLLKRRADGTSSKAEPPLQLLAVISTFLAANDFDATAAALQTERRGSGLLGGDAQDIPSLTMIYNEWLALKAQTTISDTKINLERNGKVTKEQKDTKVKSGKKKAKVQESSNSDDSDVEMIDAPLKKISAKRSSSSSSSTSSSSSSDSDADDEKETTVITSLPKSKTSSLKRKAASSSSESSTSDSSSEDEAPKSKKTKTKASTPSSSESSESSSEEEATKAIEVTSSSSGSESSSSDTDSSSNNEAPNAKQAENSSTLDSDTSSEDESESESSTHLLAIKKPLPASDSDSDSTSSVSKKPALASESSATLSDSAKKSASSSSDSSDSSSSSDLDAEPKVAKTVITAAARKLSPPLPPDPVVKKPFKKTNVPFSRIPKDIKVDERLASNAYVPYDYAQRAHEDLIVTKGKGFTKEKNKKKRGSYRGGYIDVEGKKGIKFED